MRYFIKLLMFLGLFLLAQGGMAAQPWSTWVKELRDEALANGVRAEVFDRAFADVRPVKRVTNLDRSQPEHRLTFMKYRDSRIDNYRIVIGVKEYKKRRSTLNKIGKEYGVDPCLITALWGIETSYGRFMGSFPVISSLATLAYDGRRGDFFRKELLLALQILNEDHITLDKFKGEWAGASGHSQFLPSSWHNFAVDYNHDGKKDIWTDLDDVFASIANYIAQNGWREGEPWGVVVDLPTGFDQSQLGEDNMQPVATWLAQGVRISPKEKMPAQDLMAAIVEPYGGPAFMVFQNFKTIKKYNNSIYYAASVGYLTDEICRRANN